MRHSGSLSLLRHCILGILLSLAAHPAQAGMWVEGGAPQAFEQLEAPRMTYISLYYGGDLLGTFSAHITPSQLQFDAPDAIIALIPTITDKATIRGALSNFMPMHAELVCRKNRQDGCGVLAPQTAGVIADESTLSAELFINKHYLSVTNDNAMRYLPPPPQKFSSVYAFSGAATGTQSQASSYSLTNDSIFAYGERKLTTQSTVSDQGLRFDTVAGSFERNGLEAQGGLFRSQPMQLVSDADMAGVSLSTSLHTVIDTHQNEGNTVILYLPRRAFVSIYREGRLYSSRAYEAGNQRIDTSDLPEGAYNITLRIQEADGSVREEKRFFAKNQALPPPDFPTYYLQAGVFRAPASIDSPLPELTGRPLLSAGTVQRLGSNLGWEASFLGLQDRATAETGIFWLYKDSQVRMTALSSTRGDYGVQASYLQTSDKVSAAFDVRKIWSSDPVLAPEPILSGLTQGSATLSYLVTPNVTLGARASYSQPQGSPMTASAGPYTSWHIWQQGESMLDLSADAARVAGHDEGSVLLHFSYRMGKYGVTGSAGAGYGEGANGLTGNMRLWEDETTPDHHLLAGANVSGDHDNQTLSADGEWHNHTGEVRGSVQETLGRNGPAFGYGGNFSINAAQLENQVHLGGDQTNESAIVVEATGDNAAAMKIYVNNTLRSTVTVGKSQVIYLTPYHTYRVRIISGQDALLDYDVAERPVTLYPGNVIPMRWNVNTFYVVSGRIVTPQRRPLVNAVLHESKAQAATDESGYIQAELSRPGVLTFTTAENAACLVKLPPTKPINGVLLYRNSLPCVPLVKMTSR